VKLPTVLVPALACLALAGLARAAEDGGAGVVARMHDRYQGDWFSTVRFAQKTTTFDSDGKPTVQDWYERIALPGKLRIDIGAPADGNAMILVDGQLHTFKDGKQVDAHPLVSLALLLGFDVYGQPATATLAQLRHEGVDTSRVHEDSWQGGKVVVVGADAGDLRSPQFWVDKERLLVLRIIQPSRKDPAALSDIRFLDFRKQRHGVIAARVEVHQLDRLVMSEDYSGIESDIPMDAAWFDPARLAHPE
jgi:hypothetical protein